MRRSHTPFAVSLLAAAAALAPVVTMAAAGSPWRVHALTGARVVIAPGQVLPRATVIIRDGVIAAVGADIAIPNDADVQDLSGKTIYAGLIDAFVPTARLGKETAPKDDDEAGTRRRRRDAEETPKPPGAVHDIASIHPERDVAEDLAPTTEGLERYRAMGFVAARVVPDDGIVRGLAAVLSLGDGSVNRLIVRPGAAQVVALEPTSGNYPDSLMGVIALLRQTFADAAWYSEAQTAYAHRPAGRERPERNLALAALGPTMAGSIPLLVESMGDAQNVMRANRLAGEYHLPLQVVASGSDYLYLDEIAESKVPLVVPLDFPEPPKVGDDDDEWTLVDTNALRRWKRAPANPGWLAGAGVEMALSTARLKDPTAFPERLRAAIAAGLDPKAALAALTTVPARLLGVERMLGTIAAGKIASLVVTDGDLFDEDSTIVAVWVDGQRFEMKAKKPSEVDPKGTWLISVALASGDRALAALELKGGSSGLEGTLVALSGRSRGRTFPLDCAAFENGTLLVHFPGDALEIAPKARLVATFERDALTGSIDAAGLVMPTRGERASEPAERKRKWPLPPRRIPKPEGGPIAEPQAVLVRNATVWTVSSRGTLAGADLLVVAGKVQAVGSNLTAPPGALIIDGTGKHVTPGIIDAHSHTAITGGVNEGTHAVTAEVRIGDVVDGEDWDIYSELAGGLTVANQLHGSANPIGGQSQTIKLRWGAPPEALKLVGAKPGIKFALGENVKQSNWGDAFTSRYPQTRMGVEQVMRERFLAARDYMRKQAEYREKRRTDPDAIPPRPDWQLETIAEILRGERIIHCHSYRQDEILMLVRLMDELGVTIGTFQHVLDGYKVADEIAAHGAGASTFSDWWAYKFEVYDAIPFNGSLMWDRGVVVSFNSDSNELARRLNTEATKAVKYGGVAPEEALKFVTLNPALQLRIADRVGTLEPGKDGDFVLWNGPPLSTLTLAEQTWIEGRKYFDRSSDIAARAERERERSKLIAEVKELGDSAKGDGPKPRRRRGGDDDFMHTEPLAAGRDAR